MTIDELRFDFLDDESAKQAIEIVGTFAEEYGIDWALSGGVAISLYGSDRLTKNIDIIASNPLPSQNRRSPGNTVRAANVITPRRKKRPLRWTG
jgi:hypothetical protein